MGFTGWSSFWPRSRPIWLRQWSAMVDLVWTHIKFTNIRPLEGNEGVFICILCRFSRILTTRSAKRPTYGHFLRLVDSCINLEKFGPIQRSVDSCIPSKIRTNSAVRGFLYSFSKVGPIQWSVDLSLKIHTDSAVRGFLRLFSKFLPIQWSVDSCIPHKNSDRFSGPWIPTTPLKNSDQFSGPWFSASYFKNPNLFRCSYIPASPFTNLDRFGGPGIPTPHLKILTDLALHGSLDPLQKFEPIQRSVDPYTPL